MAAESKKKRPAPKKKAPSLFPLEGELTHGGSRVVLSITRLNLRGLVADVKSGICHVGIHYQCKFILTGSRVPTEAEGQVSRTHDGVNPRTRAVQRTVEVLFIKMGDIDKKKIKSFLSDGQKE